MRCICGLYERDQNGCTEITHHKAYDVADNNDRCSELYVEMLLITQYEKHRDSQDGKQQLVFNSEPSAAERYGRVQYCEDVDDPLGFYCLEYAHFLCGSCQR